ncbi:hypothetical protein LCGC14_2277310, partial [marine sediment metagenome]
MAKTVGKSTGRRTGKGRTRRVHRVLGDFQPA